jgi:hypothetical protein
MTQSGFRPTQFSASIDTFLRCCTDGKVDRIWIWPKVGAWEARFLAAAARPGKTLLLSLKLRHNRPPLFN